MPTFISWLKKGKNEDSPYGDLAKDVCEDPNVKNSWSHRRFKKYLIERRACERVMMLLDELAEIYTIEYVLKDKDSSNKLLSS